MIQFYSGKTNVNEGETADIVLVIGPDPAGHTDLQEAAARFERQCQQQGLKYVILGGGENPVDPGDIARLPKAKNASMLGHGGAKPTHTMRFYSKDKPATPSVDMIQALQNQTGAKRFIANACWSGKINQNIQDQGKNFLLPGTEIITAASADSMVRSDLASHVMDNYIAAIGEAKSHHAEPEMRNIFRGCLSWNPETMTYGKQTANGYEKFTVRREDRAASSNHNVESWMNNNVNNYNQFLNSVGEKNVAPIEMTAQRSESYRQRSFLYHVYQCDIPAVKAILNLDPDILKRIGPNAASALFLALSRTDGYERAVKYGRTDVNAREMFKVLIEHDHKRA